MRTVALFACCLMLPVACAAESATDGDLESSEDALTAYRVRVTTPSAVAPGTTAQLAIQVVGAGGVPVTQFDELHTQTMHVVAVSSDLQDFLHVHPVLGDTGTLSVAVPIALSQPYRFFFEYDPAGPAGEQTNRALLRPVASTSVAPSLASATAFDGSAALSTLSGTTRVELQPVAHGMIMPGTSTTLRVAVTTSSGAPVTDLVDWLGMPGHAIVLSEDTSTFIHAHAMRPGRSHTGGHGGGHEGHAGMGGMTGPSDAGNVLDIDVKLPRAGLYKMFVQVKRHDAVVTAPFVLRAMVM